jgi:hypothetical protein
LLVLLLLLLLLLLSQLYAPVAVINNTKIIAK